MNIKNIEIFFCSIRDKIKECKEIKNEEIIESFVNINELAKKLFNIESFVKNETLMKIETILLENDNKIYSNLFDILKTVTTFIYESKNDDFRQYLDHPNLSYFKSLFSLSLDLEKNNL